MSCERCGGLMVMDTICGFVEKESSTGTDTVRCLNCGNFEDRIIRTNRVISRSPRHVEPHTVGTRRPSSIQPGALERPTRADGTIAENPPGRGPRLPVGTPSAETRTLESVHIEQPTQILQTQRRYA